MQIKRESAVEKRLREGIQNSCPGCLCLKFTSPGFTGVPDRIILLYGGEIVFAETKATGKVERKRQTFVQDILSRMGFKVFRTVDSEERVNAVVEYCKARYEKWLHEAEFK